MLYIQYTHSLVPAMCNRTSCAQVHELPQSHCGDNREVTLLTYICIVFMITYRYNCKVTCTEEATEMASKYLTHLIIYITLTPP